MFFRHAIISGKPLADGWFHYWFTRGLSLVVLLVENVRPLFHAAQRIETVSGNTRTGLQADRVWKFQKDVYDVAVDWEGERVLPVGSTALYGLVVVVKDAGGADVTGTLVVDSGISGLVSWATIQGGTQGSSYSVLFRQTFNNGKVLEKYIFLDVRNPRDQALLELYKYPNEQFAIPVQWAGRYPRGAANLDALAVSAFNAAGDDQTGAYVAGGSTALGSFSIGQFYGGTIGEKELIEFGQAFNNGRVFYDYAWLTIVAPVA